MCRMSARFRRRCVATLWRKVWQVTCFLIPAFCVHGEDQLVHDGAVELCAALAHEELLARLRARSFGRPSVRYASIAARGGRRERDVTILPPLPHHDPQRAGPRCRRPRHAERTSSLTRIPVA